MFSSYSIIALKIIITIITIIINQDHNQHKYYHCRPHHAQVLELKLETLNLHLQMQPHSSPLASLSINPLKKP